MTASAPLISLRSVSRTYRTDGIAVTAVRNVSFDIAQGEIAARLLVLSERAADRHKPVADNCTSNLGAGDPRNRVTSHPWWQRHDLTRVASMIEPIVALPVLIDNVAVAKVGDAGTTNPAETGKGRRVAVLAD